jgi:hypothetical protein
MGCGHELLENRCIEDLKESNSDTGLLLTNFQELYPDVPTVIIHRNVDDVVKSLVTGGAMADKRLLTGLQNKAKSLNGLHVRFEDINERMPEIYRYLTGKEIDYKKLESFKGMNIQPQIMKGTVEYMKHKGVL